MNAENIFHSPTASAFLLSHIFEVLKPEFLVEIDMFGYLVVTVFSM